MSFFRSSASCIKSSNSWVRCTVVARSRPYMRPTKRRYSSAVRRPKSAMPSGTTPICRLISAELACRSCPRMRMLPDVGASNPVNILMVVDLPAPLGPRNPKNCPASTRRFTLSTAVKSPKRRVNAAVSIAGVVMLFPAFNHDTRCRCGFTKIARPECKPLLSGFVQVYNEGSARPLHLRSTSFSGILSIYSCSILFLHPQGGFLNGKVTQENGRSSQGCRETPQARNEEGKHSANGEAREGGSSENGSFCLYFSRTGGRTCAPLLGRARR